MLKSTLIKLHAAATIFAQRGGCSAQDISEILDIPVSSVYHLAKQPEWDEALDTLNYTGDRQFQRKRTRDALRDTGELVAQTRGLYLKQRWDGLTHKKAVTAVVSELGAASETEKANLRRRINDWADRYNWEKHL